MQMNTSIIVAVIAGAAAIISAAIAYFKDPAPATPVPTKTTVTTTTCAQTSDGDTVCTATGQVITEIEYKKQ